jgi:hypothetical protein
MSWGVLNNQRDRNSSEPLPDFLTGQTAKGASERVEQSLFGSEDVITRRPEKPYGLRHEASRGYGVAYQPSPINIQLSKKMMLFMVFIFTLGILMAFGAGYVAGNMTTFTFKIPLTTSSTPVKKPLIPVHKKIKIELPVAKKVEEILPENNLAITEPEPSVAHNTEENIQSQTENVSSTTDNKENNKSEKDDAQQLPEEPDTDIAD